MTVSAKVAAASTRGANTSEWIHVPTPGDHYSPATGSAIMTIVYEMARHHAAAGGQTRIIIGERTYGNHYPAGEAVSVRFKHLAPPSRAKKAIEAGLGRLGVRRVFSEAYYRPALDAIEPGFEGLLFIHNSPAAIPLFVRERPEAKVCLWAHNELFRTFAKRETERTVADAAHVICVSEFIADAIRRRVAVSLREKIVVVHNGVDTERFHPPACAPEASAGAPVILFLGRVMEIKGPDLLVGAAKLLAARGLRFRLRIVGSAGFSASDPMTPYERGLRELAAPLGDKVEFVPFTARDRIVQEYQAASIFCAPSNWDEPFGLTIAEAMACGLPVVTSLRGGIPEVGGDAVLYFDPPDIEGLATHFERLILHPTERIEWGHKARERAIELDWSKQYEVLKEAVAKPSSRLLV